MSAPEGMREVSETEFFATVGKMNVHPRHHEPHRTSWESPDRLVHGITYPGWKNPGDAKHYFVRRGAA